MGLVRADLPPERNPELNGVRIYTVGVAPVTAILLGEPLGLYTHWVDGLTRPCDGGTCAFCGSNDNRVRVQRYASYAAALIRVFRTDHTYKHVKVDRRTFAEGKVTRERTQDRSPGHSEVSDETAITEKHVLTITEGCERMLRREPEIQAGWRGVIVRLWRERSRDGRVRKNGPLLGNVLGRENGALPNDLDVEAALCRVWEPSRAHRDPGQTDAPDPGQTDAPASVPFSRTHKRRA